VGSGLKTKQELRKPTKSLVDSHLAYISEDVQTFAPEANSVTTSTGRTIGYENLIVATGLKINYEGISGLPEGLADPNSGVSTIYSYDYCDKVKRDVDALKSGRAIFTQPAGIIKCPGGRVSFILTLMFHVF
jgi:eukaryotic sulfide quinone oxidoreductase